MKITGILRTLSPLTIGAPGDKRVDLNGRYSAKGFPCTRISMWSIPATADSNRYDFPVVPANTLRGALRRAAAAAVEKALIGRGERIHLAAYNVLRCGAVFGNPDGQQPTVAEVQAAAEFPPLAVFGGGPHMFRSALRVDTGLPLAGPLLERGLIADHYVCAEPREERDAEGSIKLRYPALTTVIWRRRADDLGGFVDPANGAELIVDYRKGVDAWQALFGSEVSVDGEPDDKAGTKVKGLASLTAMDAVLPGVDFTFELTLDTDHPASVGYLLLGLEAMYGAQRLGGNGRIGFGHFALDLQAIFEGGQSVRLFGAHGKLNRDAPEVAAAVTAAERWLDDLGAAQINAMATISNKSKESLLGKVKGDAAKAALSEVMQA